MKKKADPLAAKKAELLSLNIKDPALYAHTLQRVRSMTESALLARIPKITHKEKMQYFGRVLIDCGEHPVVLSAVLKALIAKGW
jgi:hypothetical protein